MSLTMTQKLIAKAFSTRFEDKENALGAMCILKTEELREKMLEFLEKNPKATEQEILKFVVGLQMMNRVKVEQSG